MAITYNAGTNVITVTGYTEGTPCNLTDIYNADVAGAWGVFTRQCTDQFCSTAGIAIGDGSTATWFADTNKQIVFTSAAPYQIIYTKANAHFRLGERIAGYRTMNGCSVITQRTAHSYIRGDSESGGTAKIELYSTLLSSPTGGSYLLVIYTTGTKIYNCILTKNVYLNINAGCDFYNIALQSADAGIRASAGSFDKLTITDTTWAIFVGASAFTMKNITCRNNTYAFWAQADFDVGDGYGINWDVDNWNLLWDASATKKLYRQYEFDLKVIDKDNSPINSATVKIWDKDSSLIVDTTTNASGVIATQTITRGYYNQANGNTLQEASPHLIKIEKAGYTTYEADFTLEDKTGWLIALQTSILRNPSMSGGMV